MAALALATALAGCDVSSGEDERPKPAPKSEEARPAPAPKKASGPPDERVIRGWSRALNAGRFERAAAFFAPNALVDQGEPFRVPDRAAAVVFNRSLPCKGEVTEVDDEGSTSLASFLLSPGPGGPCEGRARVRFKIRDGKFTEFRQLPGAPLPRGEPA